jgi:hypothetical protein
MNAMGHNVKTYIGVDQRDVKQKISRVLGGGYMPMGSAGMAEMGEMEMAAPDNTLPMMTGFGQFGPMEMGGMFTVVKVREGLAPNDYKDPGWYKHPEGTVAYEYTGPGTALGSPPRKESGFTGTPAEVRFKAVKPKASGKGHSNH